MKARAVTIVVLALVLVVALAAPAFAMTGADGAGRDFGQHVRHHVQEIGHFTGDMNPGYVHQGFSGWPHLP